MGCLAVFRTVILTEPWRTSPNFTSFSLSSSSSISPNLKSSSRCGCRIASRVRDFDSGRRSYHQLNCSHNENASSSSSSSMENEQEPPQEAVLKAISEVSKAEGRVGQTTNMVLGGTVTDDSTNEWLSLNETLNIYPTARGFTAIGSGGDDFVQAMVVAVESVIQHPIPQAHGLVEYLKYPSTMPKCGNCVDQNHCNDGQRGPGEAEIVIGWEICLGEHWTCSNCF